MDIKLDAKTYKQIQKALISAFPSYSKLEMMVKFAIDKSLNTITTSQNNLEKTIFDLIEYADSQGKLQRLIEGACEENKGNYLLKSCYKELFEVKNEDSLNHDNTELVSQEKVLRFQPISYQEKTWVGRENLLNKLNEKLRNDCRILIITGITGQGKTALGEHLGLVELKDDWHYLAGFDFNFINSQNFASFGADLLSKYLGENIGKEEKNNSQYLLDLLVHKLRNFPYLLQLDSVEMLLKGEKEEGCNEFKDEWWIKFFNRVLSNSKSRIIITTQDLPTEFYRYEDFFHEEKLGGLKEDEQLALFTKYLKLDNLTAETEKYLLKMGNAYEGHPLVIKIVVGEIKNKYKGNVVNYWHKYKHEFQLSGKGRSNLSLKNKVRKRVKDTLKRLKDDIPLAYELLCRSSVYRVAVPESFWLEMLNESEDEEKYTALNVLESRALLIEDTEKDCLRQHYLIRTTAYNLLEDRESAHKIAMSQWLAFQTNLTTSPYQREGSKIENSNLERVQGYLEAFHHCCELQDYEKAGKIISTEIEGKELYNKLSIWGYYGEEINIYKRLLGNLDSWQGTCLTGLGNAYNSLGEYGKAIDFYQQYLKITREIGDHSGEGISLNNLGNAYENLGEYGKAIDFHQQSLKIKREIGDHSGEGNSLGNLGNAYYSLGEYGKAIDFHQQSLNIAREIGDRNGEGRHLGNMGNAYHSLGEYEKAIDFLQQSLKIKREIGNRSGEGISLGNLGETFLKQEKYKDALKYTQEALEILGKIGYRHAEAYFLKNLAEIQQKLGNLDLARKYCDEALNMSRELGIPLVKDCEELKQQL